MQINWSAVSKGGKQLTISPQENLVKLFINTIQEMSLSYYHHFHKINGPPDTVGKIVAVQDIWSVHCYAGDYNPLHNHLCDILQGLSGIYKSPSDHSGKHNSGWLPRVRLWTHASNRVVDIHVFPI